VSGLLDLMDAAMSQIENTLADALEDLNVDAQFSSGRLNSPSTTPAIDIYPGLGRDTDTRMFATDYDGGGYLFTVRARLSTNDYDANQRILYRLMDETDELSLAQALDDEPTLGGIAASIDCLDPSGETLFQDPGGVFYGFQFTLRVLAAYS
jgi:glycine/D-amino acid oxidase-like deaminating enzyme